MITIGIKRVGNNYYVVIKYFTCECNVTNAKFI